MAPAVRTSNPTIKLTQRKNYSTFNRKLNTKYSPFISLSNNIRKE
jgi:hypothetical protein